MQWRTLEPERSILQADGNGYIMNATEVTGLGMVLKLTADGRPKEFPRIIPSVAPDKLACGIIPGDPALVGDDFNLIDNERKPVGISGDDGMLAKIGVANEKREFWRKSQFWETHNELIVLLCPFLPLKGQQLLGSTVRPHKAKLRMAPHSIFGSVELYSNQRSMSALTY